MKASVDGLTAHCQSQLDHALELWGIGFGFGERLTAMNAEAVRAGLAQAEANRELLLRGDVTGVGVGIGRVAAAHWQSWLACGTEFQTQWQASLRKIAAGTTPAA